MKPFISLQVLLGIKNNQAYKWVERNIHMNLLIFRLALVEHTSILNIQDRKHSEGFHWMH